MSSMNKQSENGDCSMRRSNSLYIGLVSGALFTYMGYLQAASVQTSITATILTPISISKQADLAFGEVYPDGTLAGTVTVDFTGGRTFSGGAAAGTASGAAGSFTVSGETGSTYVLTIPATVNLTGPGTDMTVSLNDNASGDLSLGSDTFQIGGVLNVGANQTSGAYSASFTVTVNYN